eukprot:13523605-Ditylum_brightwellii.AAC.1
MFKSGLLKLGNVPIIKQVLCYETAQWCTMTPLPTLIIAYNAIGDVVQSAVENQHQIGWNNFMKGRISIMWKVAQKMYTDELPVSKKSKDFNKELWSSRVITEIWSIFRQIWNTWNVHLHTEMTDTYSTILNKQVRKAFALQHSISETDQFLFHMPLQDQLKCHHDGTSTNKAGPVYARPRGWIKGCRSHCLQLGKPVDCIFVRFVQIPGQRQDKCPLGV